MSAVPRTGADVLVIGAGAVGSAVAFYCARAGMSVTVLNKGKPGGGTSSRCEGNLLVSDKKHGPELDLANYSLDLWRGELEEFGHLWEFENKGGIIVASRESSMTSLQRALRTQREHGIRVEEIDVAQLRELEPNISDDAVGAAFYPDDAQLMPMLLTAHMLRLARSYGAQVHPDTEVTGFRSQGERITGVTTNRGEFQADVVINAAGPWSGQLASLAGVSVPVEPRRGYVLVTEPLPPKVFHKVYAAEYIDNVGSSDDGLQTSPVVEGTPAGSILIGSSRERVGFDPTFSGSNAILIENCHNITLATDSGVVEGPGDIRISARSEFANTSDITFNNLVLRDTALNENPCGESIQVNNLVLENSEINTCQ
ncbi:FAD-binding oxidoreductase [Nesterenkonia massiliensis]|uniref:FAD-binding oxidoreductase n=1 Tax=Nesterenkonia massiliensis TaxID=1232429 RepID=A0ABT2HQD0_9MICC|nr:FAD-dependent oxidoreductase [Nesterenkonia massiliensis]MCT1606898.1 FAD-binding oxidoreductase [Nesterenkonia massiliensis]